MSNSNIKNKNNDVMLELDDCWNNIGIWGSTLPRCEKLEEYIHCRNCSIYSEAGRKVLERNLTDNYESSWAVVYAKHKQEHITEKVSVTVFRIGDEMMAIPTEYIKSINDIGNIHTVPHQSSKILRGLINLHGELKICISLGDLLGLDKATKEVDSKHQVYNRMVEISKDGNEYTFVATEVLGIKHITDKDYQSVPATISQAKGTFTQSFIKWEESDVAYLDAELLFYNLDKNLL